MDEIRFAKSPDFYVEEMDTETLLYQRDSHRAIYLNESAAMVWKLCDGTRTVADLKEFFRQEYPTAKTSVDSDVQRAVDLLMQEGALQPSTGS